MLYYTLVFYTPFLFPFASTSLLLSFIVLICVLDAFKLLSKKPTHQIFMILLVSMTQILRYLTTININVKNYYY